MMSNVAAFILALSLIATGFAIIGHVTGMVQLPDDIWGVVIALLGTAGKWMTIRQKQSLEPPTPVSTEVPNGDKTVSEKSKAVLLVLLCFTLGGCASASPQLKAYGDCVGMKALQCTGDADGPELKDKAINYSACVAGGAVSCIKFAIATQNPPVRRVTHRIDASCLHRASVVCHGKSKDVNARAKCVGQKASTCGVP